MKLRTLRNLLAAAGSSALLAGCMVGPDFVQPDSHLPEVSFQNQNVQPVAGSKAPAPTDPMWWKVFRDPVLTKLEEQVAAANLDVQTATVRLAESRFQRGVVAAAQFPSLNGSAKYNRELYSQNGIVSLISPLAGPGFAIDEASDALGATLKLPPWLEANRPQIERRLTPLTLRNWTALPVLAAE